jgi:hypothetical protein
MALNLKRMPLPLLGGIRGGACVISLLMLLKIPVFKKRRNTCPDPGIH